MQENSDHRYSEQINDLPGLPTKRDTATALILKFEIWIII